MENIALYGGEKTKTTPFGFGKRFGKFCFAYAGRA